MLGDLKCKDKRDPKANIEIEFGGIDDETAELLDFAQRTSDVKDLVLLFDPPAGVLMKLRV